MWVAREHEYWRSPLRQVRKGEVAQSLSLQIGERIYDSGAWLHPGEFYGDVLVFCKQVHGTSGRAGVGLARCSFATFGSCGCRCGPVMAAANPYFEGPF